MELCSHSSVHCMVCTKPRIELTAILTVLFLHKTYLISKGTVPSDYPQCVTSPLTFLFMVQCPLTAVLTTINDSYFHTLGVAQFLL